MNSAALKTGLLSVLGLAVSTVAGLAGCGGLWEVPKDHFDGVNEFGYVSYWDKIADIDIGEDKPFPIVIGFQSDRETSSPYLGYGWVMPLLESYMVQTGENTFQIMKPTGYTSGFGRDPKSDTAIGGVQGWKGQIGVDTIKVWAPCGWSLSYTRGKLAEIGTPKGNRIVLKRDLSGQVEDISMDSRILVKIIKGFGGRVDGLEVEGKKIEVELDEKPRVQSVQGKDLIAGKDLSLGKIGTLSSGKIGRKTYQYGLSETLQPKIIIKKAGHSDREIVWNADGGLIVADGEWKYDMLVRPKAGEYAAIRRKNTNNESEFWHFDAVKGEKTSQTLDGVRTITTWFTSGVLTGNIRKVVKIHPDGKQSKKSYVYDDLGRLIRILDNEKVAETHLYTKEGSLLSTSTDTGNSLFIRDKTDEWEVLLKNLESLELDKVSIDNFSWAELRHKDGQIDSLFIYSRSGGLIVELSGGQVIQYVRTDDNRAKEVTSKHLVEGRLFSLKSKISSLISNIKKNNENLN